MSLRAPTKLIISIPFLCVFYAQAYAGAMSTVLPYMHEAQMSINSQVTSGMTSAKSRIDTIRENAEKKLEPEYAEKEKNLESIRKLQAQSLLLMKQIESAQTKNADLRSSGAKAEGAAGQATLINAENGSVLLFSESH